MAVEQPNLNILFKVTKGTLKKYEENAVYFGVPQLVALFDYNHERITKAKRMKYLKVPDIGQYPLCLNGNLETYIIRNPTVNFSTIDIPLKYLSSPAFNSACENVDKTKVITRSGVLLYLMELSQNRIIETRKIKVSRYNNNLYMQQQKKNENHKCELKLAHTHHLQLDRMLFVDSPHAAPENTGSCDENVMLVAVRRSSFGKYDVIYSHEFQGIISDETITDFDDLDEIAHCRFVLAKQMRKTLKNTDMKYLHYWLQSYLTNVRDIYVGLKDNNGVINEPLQHMLVKDLPNNRYWKPSVSTGFLYNFLQNVEKIMSSVNCPNTVYEFVFNVESNCFSYEIYRGKSEQSFIPEEYQKFCNGL